MDTMTSNVTTARPVRLLTVATVAERLNCNEDMVLRLLRKGTLYGAKLGPRTWRITEEAFADYLVRIGAAPR